MLLVDWLCCQLWQARSASCPARIGGQNNVGLRVARYVFSEEVHVSSILMLNGTSELTLHLDKLG